MWKLQQIYDGEQIDIHTFINATLIGIRITQLKAFDMVTQNESSYLEALGDDAVLGALASGEVLVQSIDEPGPEVQHIPLLLYGEALVAAAHHRLHELMRAHLHHNQTSC